MKKTLLVFVTLFIAISAKSQCSDVLIDSALTRLDGATYMNAFRILMKKGKKNKIPTASFKVQMNKGNIYRFIVSEAIENKEPLVATLSDDFKKYGSSFDNFEGVNYKGFDFKCTKTGYYYLSAFFKDGEEGCGVIVMSLIKVQNQFLK